MNCSRYFTKSFSLLFCLMLSFSILVVPSALFLTKDKTYSQEENRMLATFPAFSSEMLLEGQYTEELSQYLRDQLPLRVGLLKTKAVSEYALLKRENNRVIAAKDGYLIKHFSYGNQQLATFSENQNAIQRLAEALVKYQRPATFVCAPRAVDVLDHLCPSSLSEPRSVWDTPALQGTSEKIRQLLRQKATQGEPIWFRTDHHWTSLGAYHVYAALGEVFGYVPYPLSAFEAVTVCDDFLGTSYSASLPPLCHPDNITAMRYNDDDCFICTDVITKKTQHGLYRENALASASKYEYFLGPNVAHLRITKTDEPDRPALLIIKDSYAQCLAPFLARHFDIDLIDLRYFRTDATQVLREIVQAPNYAGTLILCNVDTLTADVGFTRLSPEKLQ